MSLSRILILFLILVGGILKFALAQQRLERPFGGEPGGYLFRWDAIHDILIFYRDVTDGAATAVQAYPAGSQRGTRVSPLLDFAGANAVDIWAVAAGPHGMLVISGVVQYGPMNARMYLLTYDAKGVLRKLWEVYPYHHHQIAVDSEGSVYALGHREDRADKPNEEDYPLLIKYSPEGDVLWGTAFRKWFPYEREIVITNAATGEHFLGIDGESVILYLATVQELLRFSTKDGSLLARSSLAASLQRLGEGAASVQIMCLAPSAKGSLLAQVRLIAAQGSAGKTTFAMAEGDSEGKRWRTIASPTPIPWPGIFLGTEHSGKCVYVSKDLHGRPLLSRVDCGLK